eukprot:SAG25_NODE_14763_length_251_cov_0.677632_1_plen_76_part_10
MSQLLCCHEVSAEADGGGGLPAKGCMVQHYTRIAIPCSTGSPDPPAILVLTYTDFARVADILFQQGATRSTRYYAV